MRTLNLIDMAVVSRRAGSEDADSSVAAELGVTLRACHAARALAAASPVLRVLGADNNELLAYVEADVMKDLGNDLADLALRDGRVILEILASAKIRSDHAPQRAYKPQDAPLTLDLYTFTAAAEHRDLPENVDDWVFVHGSVLVALVRCWNAGLQDHDLAQRICPLVGFNTFMQSMRREIAELPQLDNRLRLFGLWALSHIDATTPGGPLRVPDGDATAVALPPGLAMEADDLKWFTTQIETVCNKLLEDKINLADTYSPYTFWIGPQAWDYKDDSLVVPVVPLLLSLAARYAPAVLSRRRVLRLVQQCSSADARKQYGLAARPYQLSSQDGVVNLSYYQEACEEVAVAARTAMNSFPRRVRAHLSAFANDWGRAAIMSVFVVVGVLIVSVFEIKDSAAAGFVYGVYAAVLAAIVVPPVVAWIWGDL
jgi:hypothetical protein